MSSMEGTTEVNEHVDDENHETTSPRAKRREQGQAQQQQAACSAMASTELPATFDTEWKAHIASLRAIVMAARAGSSSTGQSTVLSRSGPVVHVEGQSQNNYTVSNQMMESCSNNRRDVSSGEGAWQTWRRVVGERREESQKESINREYTTEVTDPMPTRDRTQGPKGLNVSEHTAGSDSLAFANTSLAPITGEIRTKVLQASRFPQYLIKSSLKGKGVAYRHHENRDVSDGMQITNAEKCSDKRETAENLSCKPSAEAGEASSVGGGGGSSSHHPDGITLREWLDITRCKVNKIERLHIFKQIVELVDTAHSEGLVLMHLRPSYFMIPASNKVKYVGAVSPLDVVEQRRSPLNQNFSSLGCHLKRKDQSLIDTTRTKYHRVGEHNHDGVRYQILADRNSSKDKTSGSNACSFKAETSGPASREQLKRENEYNPQCTSGNPPVMDSRSHPFAPEFLKLEERWYSGPDVLDEGSCSLSTNVYSLGVLLFELFCYFESWKIHSAAMSDLQHRILPPHFLSGNYKEAGFCLWLLHPDPTSRPKSREILLCDLITGCRDLDTIDRSPSHFDEDDAESELLLHFLTSLKEEKETCAAKLVLDLGCLNVDLEEVQRRQPSRTKTISNAGGMESSLSDTSRLCPCEPSLHSTISMSSTLTSNEDRLMKNIEQLENAYLSVRTKVDQVDCGVAVRSDRNVLRVRNRCSRTDEGWREKKKSTDQLGKFFEGLCKFARYNNFEVHGNLRNIDIFSSTNVICSLSFDRAEDYFAAAGVSKKIKIYDFNALLDDDVDIHYPVVEMSSRSKLSCVSWNNYIRNYLASSDYEGVVQLWDANTGQAFAQYVGHQKRAWSVDFSRVDPTKLASGSDDYSVKLWSINEKNCIDTVRNVANVCCVQFSPYSSHLLAFGSADYKVCCYDMRNTRIPWCTLGGHGKAVSYVKFLDNATLVSASTDSTLRIWDLNMTKMSGLSTAACSLTLTGHVNEKNFVGLSVCDGYIVCGSETNEVYAYYKDFPMPITSHNFGCIDPITGNEIVEDNGQFVSSVCWRRRSNMVVAANSCGSMKVLQLE